MKSYCKLLLNEKKKKEEKYCMFNVYSQFESYLSHSEDRELADKRKHKSEVTSVRSAVVRGC